jgi:hypothetical protein
MAAMENALRLRPKDEEALEDEQIKKLKQKVGALVLESDVLKEAVKPWLPFDRGTSVNTTDAACASWNRSVSQRQCWLS